ncbi:20648_t:CDS:2, partial [Gigaspora rosea]
MPPESIPKKTRSRISDKQKKEICEFAKMNPSYKQHQIANEFNQCYPDLKMDRSTVSKILKKTDEYQQIEDNLQAEKTFRHRSVKYPMLELGMNMWVERVTTEGLILSESLIKEKAQQFAQALDMPKSLLHFRMGSAPLETLPAERIKLQELLSHYDLEDIYNADETGLFYRLLPNPTLSKKKKLTGDKTRVTVLLCSNSTGSNKLRPLLKFIDEGFRIQGRQVLLLVDNASFHTAPETSNSTEVQDAKESVLEDDSNEEIEVREQPGGRSRGRSRGRTRGRTRGRRPQGKTQKSNSANSGRSRRISDKLHLTNTTVHFLPPLTTAHLQTMNAGIIKSFKSKYKNMYCRYLLDQFEENRELKKLTIRKAIDFISDAWNEVSETTIRNCWKTTRIMPETNELEESESDDEPEYETPEINNAAML